jgi:hypothetical protein
MAQKPVDKRSPLETRDAIWAAIRRLRSFNLAELRGETRCGAEQVRDYVTGLTAAGLLEKSPPAPPSIKGGVPVTYKLVRDCGVEAPQVRKDGSEITMGKAQEQMWLVMKVLGEFSALDLAVHASTETVAVTEAGAKSYIHYLHKGGYLAMVANGKPGHRKGGGILARYRFLPSRYTGPRPPMVQRVKQVYDPNLKKVVWSGGADE